ncbi:major facilitator superfamily domain-containing protein [Roridomyces roridus]|uniref:Major facilitator superfamily domain-containing protein n=1 Tax=Roridomyces roridus TaxID=1738132 RepID=A0AAD7FHC5_9AGAR|nr:major facilitator superfamily domain-containing protein [Roridomyces roridus]
MKHSDSKPVDVEKTIEFSDTDSLSDEHRQYLLQRHGTVELDPMPSMDPEDPYNWSTTKKVTNLVLVSFHAMMGIFTASAIQSAFVPIAHDLHVAVQRASYLTALVIAIVGSAPILWRPLANRYGRRPIFLLSLICSLVGNIGCAKSPTYSTMALCRAITAFFISPASAIGSAVVTETFFKHERATYMGIWTIMVVPVAPLIFGFVAERVNYRWIYWILAMINGAQFVLYYIFGRETLYMRDIDVPKPTRSFLGFHRIDPRPLTLLDFIHPFSYFLKPRVLFPSIAYAMIFLWACIMPNILIPQIFPKKFGLNAQQVGLQFIATIIGSVIGEQIGGRMSDRWMRRQGHGRRGAKPEYRLWLTYPGFALAIIGVVVFCIQVGRAGTHWNITPLVGVTIGYMGNQLITTVLVTYAVDCYRPDAAAVGVFIVFVRQMWGFVGPFWLPNLIDATSFNATAGIAAAFMVVFSIIPIVSLHNVMARK